jgi:preprotein translocase subunit SecA
MMEGIKEESVGNLFNLKVEVQQNPIVEEAEDDTPAGLGGPAPQQPPSVGRHARGSARPAQQPRSAPAEDAASAEAGRAANGDARQQASGASVVAPGLSRPKRPTRLSYSAPSADGGGQVERRTDAGGDDKFAKVGRNAPCPCGSGKKYKVCHGDPRNRANG